MGIVRVFRVPLVKLPADMKLSAEERTRYEMATLRNESWIDGLKKQGHPVEWYPVPYLVEVGTDLGQAHLGMLTLACIEPHAAEAKAIYNALEETFKYSHIKGNITGVWSGEPAAIITKYATQVRKLILKAQEGEPQRIVGGAGMVRKFIDSLTPFGHKQPAVRIPFPRRKGPPHDFQTSRREQQYRERWQHLYESVVEKGYNVGQYHFTLRPETAPLVNYAMRLTKSLAILDKDRDEVITVCGRLDSVWQMLCGHVPVDLTVTEWEVPCVESELEGPDYLNEILSPKAGKVWMGSEPSGFDRNARRPQRNLPVLTIELPDGKEPMGIRHEIALHLEQIGFAVKFKN